MSELESYLATRVGCKRRIVGLILWFWGRAARRKAVADAAVGAPA